MANLSLLDRLQNLCLFLKLFSLFFISVNLFSSPANNTESAIRLHMPIDCIYGKNCFIQNYFDINSDKDSYQDYRCGNLAYNGHKGTDFRLLDYKQLQGKNNNSGVNVLAAADGIVLNTRNNQDDYIPIKNKECGNGVVINHTNFKTQYCHLKKGSILVRPGDKVKAGAILGKVGMSGATEFPHLHLSVIKINPDTQEEIHIDPFTSEPSNLTNNCYNNYDPSLSLWTTYTSKKLKYIPTAVLSFNVTDLIPNKDQARHGNFRENKLTEDSNNIVLWADIMGVKKNDEINFIFKTKEGKIIFDNSSSDNKTNTIEKDYVQYFTYYGKKITSIKPGEFLATLEIIRNNEVIISKTITVR